MKKETVIINDIRELVSLITDIPEDKEYSTGSVTFDFYTMQRIEKPDFSK